jgi:tRNA A37 threonylcarbamoyladenosine dehydratase
MTQTNKQRFGAVARLHGDKAYEKLTSAHVCVIGVGGVGSWACEILARNAIGEITLIDADDVCITNINRQIHALTQTVGHEKVKAMSDRIKSINPDCIVHEQSTFFLQSTAEKLLEPKYDFVIDAIDSIKHKSLLIATCKERRIPMITIGGAGGKVNIAGIQVSDLGRSYDDRLLCKLRKELRNKYGFPRFKNKKFHVQCVFSPEMPKLPWCELPEGEEKTSLKLDCNNGFGTDAAVISVFGITAAHYVISQIINT